MDCMKISKIYPPLISTALSFPSSNLIPSHMLFLASHRALCLGCPFLHFITPLYLQRLVQVRHHHSRESCLPACVTAVPTLRGSLTSSVSSLDLQQSSFATLRWFEFGGHKSDQDPQDPWKDREIPILSAKNGMDLGRGFRSFPQGRKVQSQPFLASSPRVLSASCDPPEISGSSVETFPPCIIQSWSSWGLRTCRGEEVGAGDCKEAALFSGLACEPWKLADLLHIPPPAVTSWDLGPLFNLNTHHDWAPSLCYPLATQTLWDRDTHHPSETQFWRFYHIKPVIQLISGKARITGPQSQSTYQLYIGPPCSELLRH
jgi:hypothetical protein